MALAELLRKKLRLVLFGGKGGVGKTTCASACALYFSLCGRTTALLSSDPAHSLSDCLDMKLEGLSQVPGHPLLLAEEMDSQKALRGFKKRFAEEIQRFFTTSTNLDDEDASELINLPLPGLDELMGLMSLMDYLRERKDIDLFVMDTAPTGHTLRLLAVPDMVDDWIKVFARMRWKYRYVVKRFSGKYDADKVDEMLLGLKKMILSLRELLRDPGRCEFVIVTNPRVMVLRETERLVESLRELRIPLGHMVVNNVTFRESFPVADHQEILERLVAKFPGWDLTVMPVRSVEVLGLRHLQNFAGDLFRLEGTVERLLRDEIGDPGAGMLRRIMERMDIPSGNLLPSHLRKLAAHLEGALAPIVGAERFGEIRRCLEQFAGTGGGESS